MGCHDPSTTLGVPVRRAFPDAIQSPRRASPGSRGRDEREDPRVEIVEAPGLAGSTSSARATWTAAGSRSASSSIRSIYQDVFSRNQRRRVDEYDDHLFIVLHFPRYDKTVSRLNAAELDLFVGADYLITLPNEPLQPVEYLFERCRTNEQLREEYFSKGPGYLLYKIVDDCVDVSFRCCARSATSSSGSSRTSSRAAPPKKFGAGHLETPSRRSSTSAR